MQPTCTTSTGSITITSPTGAGVTYSINGTNYQAGTTFSGLLPGSYNVTARNVSGCTSAPTVAVVNSAPLTPPTPVLSAVQPTCTQASGSITVSSPTGAGITYSINGSAFQSSTLFSNLVAGTYSVVAKNASGCVSNAVSVTLIQPANCDVAGIFPTATSCSDFLTGTAPFTEVCYTVSSGVISNCTPGVFFYYVKVVAPSSTFTLTVNQVAQTAGFARFAIQSSGNTPQIFLWDANCNKRATGVQTSVGQASVTITNAIVGATYVLSVKYDTKSIINTPIIGTPPIASYQFTAVMNGTTVPNSSKTLLAKSSNCFSYRMSSD
ncbi:MAG: hypothetical protein ACKOQ6_06435, partial [Bacteroidota bacterium]